MGEAMRVILAGQKSFGQTVFDTLVDDGHEVAAVWAPFSDEPEGLKDRGQVTDKLALRALDWNLFVEPMQRTPKAVQQLEADLFVAAHSHDFISRAARAATRLGGVGYHPSLLPRHRGRDAIKWTVHMGDPIAGGTVYWLTDSVDGGPVAAQDWCFVEPGVAPDEEDVVVSRLWRQELFPMGIRLLRRTLRDLDLGVMVEIPQDELYATWEPSWERPPLHRPDLPQIGGVNGFHHITTRSAIA
jgi:methionyl-tRNA formyltransferase